MKLDKLNSTQTLLDLFDKELKAILLRDLQQFRRSNGQFLRNSRTAKQETKTLLVA